METVILPADSPDALPPALEILQNGGLVAFPTDTVYGLGAIAFDGKAVESIYAAKERPVEKAIPVLLADPVDMNQIAAEVPWMAKQLAAKFWPGALTILVPKRSDLPEAISANSTVGVRIPDHPMARKLLMAAGPLATTSANLSGKPNPLQSAQVFDQLSGRIPLILDGGDTPGGYPSTVVDCSGSEPLIIRKGPISLEQILEVLKENS